MIAILGGYTAQERPAHLARNIRVFCAFQMVIRAVLRSFEYDITKKLFTNLDLAELYWGLALGCFCTDSA